VVVLAGPNGAGKSTSVRRILKGALQVNEFVNADTIAQGLSGFSPESVAIGAGRLMLARLRELASARKSFAFETTLASRTFAPWLDNRRREGYRVTLVFLWLSHADMAVERVADRVSRGGHDVPELTIRRRYSAGLRNFFQLYRPLASRWFVMDNSVIGHSRLVASGGQCQTEHVVQAALWNQIQAGASFP
jgi:predicted ABC-type ATPase